VSVPVSSLLRALRVQSAGTGIGLSCPAGQLEALLSAVTDPRARRGVRYRVGVVVGVAVCAVAAGARSYTAIAEWAHDLTPQARARLALGGRTPCEATIRRVLQRMDPEQLDRAVSAWLAQRDTRPRPARRVIALDGKTVRGARTGEGRATHLLAAFDTTTGTVLGQAAVDGKTNEITAFAPLLDRLDITGALITADALHTQRGHASYLTGRGAHYLLTVKANQPTLLTQLARLPWAHVPVADRTTSTRHGRREQRTVHLTTVSAGIGFPAAATALRVTRRTRRSTRGRWHTETVHAITDLTVEATDAAELADALRGHWGIENRLHWVRDVTFTEDLSQIRTGHGPTVMATLRNLAISVHRLAGATNIAAACRRLSRHPNRVLALLT